MITEEILNRKHPIPYDTVKRLQKNAYLKGYRTGLKRGIKEGEVSAWYEMYTNREEE